jgi:hypothetical protein
VREQQGTVVLTHVAQVHAGIRHGHDLRMTGQLGNAVV